MASGKMSGGKQSGHVRIVVSRGRFRTVREASRSEKKVKWFVPDADADAVTECYAAVELADGISRLLEHAGTRDVAIGFASPGRKIANDGLRIVLGTSASNPLIKKLNSRGGMKGVKHAEGYLILAAKEDAGQVLYIAARTRKGVLNGVYRYLEELGMGWTSPDQPQAVWPKRVTLWKKGMRIKEVPHFERRGFWMEREHQIIEKLLVWMARNRMNHGGCAHRLPALAKKLGIRTVEGGDETHTHFNPDSEFRKGVTLFEAHPEWFALRNGERQPWAGLLCTSNRDAVNYLFKRVMDFVMKNAAWMDEYCFGGADCGRTCCECPECQKMGNASDRHLLLVHELRERLDAEYKKGSIDHRIVLHLEAYDGAATLCPPSKPLPKGFDHETILAAWPIRRCYAHRLADSACREINIFQWDCLTAWRRKFKGDVIIGEYYNVSFFIDMATVFSRCMFDDARDYLKAGFNGMQYMHVSPGHWGPRALTNWQFARQSWNPERDYDSMLSDFFRARFGPLARQAERLYRKLDLAMSNTMMIKGCVLGNLNWNLRRNYGDYAAPEWDCLPGHCTTVELFDYDHLRLHRPEDSDGKMGCGLDNLDDIVNTLKDVDTDLRQLRRKAGLSRVVRANLDEDIVLVNYTKLVFSLHHQFALYWEGNRYGKGNASLHRRRLLAIADELARTELPPAATAAMIAANALERSGLATPLKREFGYSAEAVLARLQTDTDLVI